MGLYDKYLELAKTAEEQAAVTELDEARVNVIREKVAEAEQLIKEAGIPEYTNNDVVDVATALINNQIEDEESQEKIAQLYDMGRIMMEGFYKRGKELAAEEEKEVK